MEKITLVELHARLRAQGVSSPNHYAFKCPVCGTVQSMASLVQAGASVEKVESAIGFSCEGRFSRAGEWPSRKDKSGKAADRRKVRGCNWTLGGFLQVHKLEVEMDGGETSPAFEIASADEARALEALLESSAKTSEPAL